MVMIKVIITWTGFPFSILAPVGKPYTETCGIGPGNKFVNTQYLATLDKATFTAAEFTRKSVAEVVAGRLLPCCCCAVWTLWFWDCNTKHVIYTTKPNSAQKNHTNSTNLRTSRRLATTRIHTVVFRIHCQSLEFLKYVTFTKIFTTTQHFLNFTQRHCHNLTVIEMEARGTRRAAIMKLSAQ